MLLFLQQLKAQPTGMPRVPGGGRVRVGLATCLPGLVSRSLRAAGRVHADASVKSVARDRRRPAAGHNDKNQGDGSGETGRILD